MKNIVVDDADALKTLVKQIVGLVEKNCDRSLGIVDT